MLQREVCAPENSANQVLAVGRGADTQSDHDDRHPRTAEIGMFTYVSKTEFVLLTASYVVGLSVVPAVQYVEPYASPVSFANRMSSVHPPPSVDMSQYALYAAFPPAPSGSIRYVPLPVCPAYVLGGVGFLYPSQFVAYVPFDQLRQTASFPTMEMEKSGRVPIGNLSTSAHVELAHALVSLTRPLTDPGVQTGKFPDTVANHFLIAATWRKLRILETLQALAGMSTAPARIDFGSASSYASAFANQSSVQIFGARVILNLSGLRRSFA